jgi:hypothetical protein
LQLVWVPKQRVDESVANKADLPRPASRPTPTLSCGPTRLLHAARSVRSVRWAGAQSPNGASTPIGVRRHTSYFESEAHRYHEAPALQDHANRCTETSAPRNVLLDGHEGSGRQHPAQAAHADGEHEQLQRPAAANARQPLGDAAATSQKLVPGLDAPGPVPNPRSWPTCASPPSARRRPHQIVEALAEPAAAVCRSPKPSGWR